MELLKREIYAYALAAVNFYGFIPLRNLTSIINNYNNTDYKTNEIEEIVVSYIDEESFVQKRNRILFQKQMFEDTDVLEVYEVLKNKPYYIPESSEEFLKYTDASYYELGQEFDDFKEFITKWSENEDMAFVMAKNAVMAFNVDAPITDLYEMTLGRLNDYLNRIQSPYYLTDVSRSKMISLLINLNHNVRKISLRGYKPSEITESDEEE